MDTSSPVYPSLISMASLRSTKLLDFPKKRGLKVPVEAVDAIVSETTNLSKPSVMISMPSYTEVEGDPVNKSLFDTASCFLTEISSCSSV